MLSTKFRCVLVLSGCEDVPIFFDSCILKSLLDTILDFDSTIDPIVSCTIYRMVDNG